MLTTGKGLNIPWICVNWQVQSLKWRQTPAVFDRTARVTLLSLTFRNRTLCIRIRWVVSTHKSKTYLAGYLLFLRTINADFQSRPQDVGQRTLKRYIHSVWWPVSSDLCLPRSVIVVNDAIIARWIATIRSIKCQANLLNRAQEKCGPKSERDTAETTRLVNQNSINGLSGRMCFSMGQGYLTPLIEFCNANHFRFRFRNFFLSVSPLK